MKTSKGTEINVISLKGRPYMLVQDRLIWFRDERPEWSIETELIVLKDEYTIAKAVIKNESGRIMATAHKREDAKHFSDHTEKSESSAIGRALAMCGFGTQFVGEDLSEGERIVDSPVPHKQITNHAPIGRTAEPPQAVIDQWKQDQKDAEAMINPATNPQNPQAFQPKDEPKTSHGTIARLNEKYGNKTPKQGCISEKQAKRMIAIGMGNGWSVNDISSMCLQETGDSIIEHVSWKKYESLCNIVQKKKVQEYFAPLSGMPTVPSDIPPESFDEEEPLPF